MKKTTVLLLVMVFVLQAIAVAYAVTQSQSSSISLITLIGAKKVAMTSSTGSTPASAKLYVRSNHYWDGGAYVLEKRIGGGITRKNNSTLVTRSRTYKWKAGAYRVAGTHKWFNDGAWTVASTSATSSL